MISKVKQIIHGSKNIVAFTGAGISVESGVPPFRGENGIWNKYNPKIFDIDYYYSNTAEDWEIIKEIFFTEMKQYKPNAAHLGLAKLEKMGILKGVITQNIDNLHTLAGSKNVVEFHGNTRQLVCTKCGENQDISINFIKQKTPQCPKCNGLMKPDFVFFGEQIPPLAFQKSVELTNIADTFIIIGTTGIIYPATEIAYQVKRNGATIIEINIKPSEYTNQITDFFVEGKAAEIISQITDL